MPASEGFIVEDSGDGAWGTDTIVGAVAGTGAAAGLLAAVFAVRRRTRRSS